MTVSLPHEGQHRIELRPLRILTGSLVEEGSVEIHSVELTLFVLIECTHPYVADALAR